MRKLLLAAALLLVIPLGCIAQTEGIKPAFREKVVEAVQFLDGVDPLDPEVSYALNVMNARNAIMAVTRMAASEKEIEVADALRWSLIYYDLARKYGGMPDTGSFKENLDKETRARDFALTGVGMSAEKLYPTPKIKWDSQR